MKAWLESLADQEIILGVRQMATGFEEHGHLDEEIAVATLVELVDRLERRSMADAREVVLGLRHRASA